MKNVKAPNKRVRKSLMEPKKIVPLLRKAGSNRRAREEA